MKSPLNYLGGKSRLAKQIVPILDVPHTCYCEAFSGAAWVFFCKERSKAEVLNDIDGELVNFWRVIQNHLEPFLDYFKFAVVSRKLFDLEKVKRPETLTDLQRAARYYYLQRLSFGGKPVSRHFGAAASAPPGLHLESVSERLLEVHWRLQEVYIENLNAFVCIERYDRPDTLFYLDPPYYGLCQDYAGKFAHADYVRLADLLATIKGRFLLSLNDCKEVREVFSKFDSKRATLTYTVCNARLANAGRDEQRAELLIHNGLIRGGK